MVVTPDWFDAPEAFPTALVSCAVKLTTPDFGDGLPVGSLPVGVERVWLYPRALPTKTNNAASIERAVDVLRDIRVTGRSRRQRHRIRFLSWVRPTEWRDELARGGVGRERWDAVSADVRERFLPLCPDVVVELRSPSDPLPALQRRMREFMRNGAQLGWLIDPRRRSVHVYRPGEPVHTLLAPDTLTGDPLLAGFILDLRRIL